MKGEAHSCMRTPPPLDHHWAGIFLYTLPALTNLPMRYQEHITWAITETKGRQVCMCVRGRGKAEGQQASSPASFQKLACCSNPWRPSSECDAPQKLGEEEFSSQRLFHTDLSCLIEAAALEEASALWSSTSQISHSPHLYYERPAKSWGQW